jgi:hypothetical protein
MFPDAVFDSATLQLLSRVFEEAWVDTQLMLNAEPLDPTSLRSALAKRLMAAAQAGERDPERLKLIALRVVGT